MALPKCFNPFKHKSRQTVKKENLNEKRKEKPPTAAAEATVSTLAAPAVQHLCRHTCTYVSVSWQVKLQFNLISGLGWQSPHCQLLELLTCLRRVSADNLFCRAFL